MASKHGEDMTHMAGKMWEFLDKLAADRPDEYKKFIEQQLEEGQHMFTPPEPIYCLQCQVRAWDITCPLYINVCKWIRVPKPNTDQDPIPVKGGVLRYLIDERTKRKLPSKDLVYDTAFNPSVLDECSQSPIMDCMLVTLILEYVESMTDLRVLDKNKYKKLKVLYKGPKADVQHSLDERWVHLLTPESKMDVGNSLLKQLQSLKTETEDPDIMGPLPPLILRSDTKTGDQSASSRSTETTQNGKRLIEEISSEQATSNTVSSDKGGERRCVPAHSLVVKDPDDNHPRRRVLVKVKLPGVTSADQVDLEVAKNDLQLSTKQHRYHLSLTLPVPVDIDTTKAKFTSKSSVLTISMPCL